MRGLVSYRRLKRNEAFLVALVIAQHGLYSRDFELSDEMTVPTALTHPA